MGSGILRFLPYMFQKVVEAGAQGHSVANNLKAKLSSVSDLTLQVLAFPGF